MFDKIALKNFFEMSRILRVTFNVCWQAVIDYTTRVQHTASDNC